MRQNGLELLPSDSRILLRPFHGHITDVALDGSDGGLARYRLVIELPRNVRNPNPCCVC
jgi:uncharacterized protein involved in type VI secretion and phage assembly